MAWRGAERQSRSKKLVRLLRTYARDPVGVTRALPGEFRQWYRWRYGGSKAPEYQVDEAWEERLHGLLGAPWPCPQGQDLDELMAEVNKRLTEQGLGAYLRLGRGEINTGGANKSSILADSMESLLGAIYLHFGMDSARDVILRLFGPLLDAAPTLGAGLDWKTSLQELTAARGLGAPSYQVTSTGPDHHKEFTAVVVVTDTEYGSGVGRSKKEAEQHAAAAAWKTLSVLDTA